MDQGGFASNYLLLRLDVGTADLDARRSCTLTYAKAKALHQLRMSAAKLGLNLYAKERVLVIDPLNHGDVDIRQHLGVIATKG